MKKATFLSIVFFLLLGYSSMAQEDEVVRKIIEIGKTDNQTMQHLDVLSNRFGGRLIGSDAYENAALWAAKTMKDWGLEVQIDYVGELPVGFNRGPWFGRMLGENGMYLHFATPSYTSGTKGVQHGHVLIEPKTQAEFDQMKGKLKGAWVLVSGTSDGMAIDYTHKSDQKRDSLKKVNEEISKKNRGILFYNYRNPDKEAKKQLEYVREPALFYHEMVEAGVLGFIQSSSIPIRVMYDRKNIWDMTWETLPTVPDIRLDEHQYKIIEQMAKERRYFQLEFDIRNHFKMGPVKYHNVIGILRGTEFPDEYVMMGGHLDAYDVATGGIDCGVGVTPAMEAARLIMEAGGKPKRSIMVCLWAGEEFGLLGSKSWVMNNKDKLDKISNYFNRDGGPTVASDVTVPEAMYDDFVKVSEPVNNINPDFPFEVKIQKPKRKPTQAGGSDHAYFAMNGVPTIHFGGGDPKGYNFSYFEIWHTERDTYDKSIPEYQNHVSIVQAVIVYGLANLDHLLSREGYYLKEEPKEKKGSKKKKK